MSVRPGGHWIGIPVSQSPLRPSAPPTRCEPAQQQQGAKALSLASVCPKLFPPFPGQLPLLPRRRRAETLELGWPMCVETLVGFQVLFVLAHVESILVSLCLFVFSSRERLNQAAPPLRYDIRKPSSLEEVGVGGGHAIPSITNQHPGGSITSAGRHFTDGR